jgi:hypothetical protein
MKKTLITLLMIAFANSCAFSQSTINADSTKPIRIHSTNLSELFSYHAERSLAKKSSINKGIQLLVVPFMGTITFFNLSCEYRFYFIQNGKLNGAYVAPYLRNKIFSCQSRAPLISSGSWFEPIDEFFIINNFVIGGIIGEQVISKKGFVFGFHMGFGYAPISCVLVDKYQTYKKDHYSKFDIRLGTTLGRVSRKKKMH